MDDGNLVNLQEQISGIHDMTSMEDKKLVNQQGQTNEVKDTARPVASIGSSSTWDDTCDGYGNNLTLDSFVDSQKDSLVEVASFDGDDYPILEHSGIDLSEYLGTYQIDMSTPWGPQTGWKLKLVVLHQLPFPSLTSKARSLLSGQSPTK